MVVPATLAVIFVLLYLLFRSFKDAGLVMAAVPFSLVGGFWLVWAAWAQHLGCDSRWLHRARGRRSGVRRRDAGLPEERVLQAPGCR